MNILPQTQELSRFNSDPCHHRLSRLRQQNHLSSSVLLPERDRKKEFPSVAKLLDGLDFHDESHPDFLIRSSSITRLQSNRSHPSYHHPIDGPHHPHHRASSSSSSSSSSSHSSSPPPHSPPTTLQIHPAHVNSSSISAVQLSPNPLITSLHRRNSSSVLNPIKNHHHPFLSYRSQSQPSVPGTHSTRITPSLRPTLPFLISHSSGPQPQLSFSITSPTDSESSSTTQPLRESLKRRRYESEDDDEDDLPDELISSEAETETDELSSSSSSELGLKWSSSKLNQSQPDRERIIACPSATWLQKGLPELQISTSLTSPSTIHPKPIAHRLTTTTILRHDQTGEVEAENRFIGLGAPRSFEVHQLEKRRRFVIKSRLHQVTR